MSEAQPVRGGGPGCLAPPVTDEHLTVHFPAAIDAVGPRTILGQALTNLLECVRVHRSHPPTPHRNVRAVLNGGEITAVTGSLEAPVKAALDPLLPSDDELRVVSQLVDDTLETEANAKNGAARETWVNYAAKTTREKLFPGITDVGFAALPEPDRERYVAEIRAAFAAGVGGTPPLPRPERVPTPTRDAARHLVWYVQELKNGREPLTQDKIV